MIKINTIKIYSHIPDRYYTDGEDIYIAIQKEKMPKGIGQDIIIKLFG